MNTRIITRDQLVKILGVMAEEVNNKDSFQGSLNYDCIDEGLPPDSFNVYAAFRTGNSMGQGGWEFCMGQDQKPDEKHLGLNELRDACYLTAYEHGWWDDCNVYDETPPGGLTTTGLDAAKVERLIPEKLMLIVSEASEALEDYRESKLEETTLDSGKPVGFPSELADIIIRVLDYCGAAGIDIEGAVTRKMAYNQTRSFKHGGKKV